MAFSIDVIASFNPGGEVKPLYFRVENPDGLQMTFAVDHVLNRKEEVVWGVLCYHYVCEVTSPDDPLPKTIDLYYHIDSHRWMTGARNADSLFA